MSQPGQNWFLLVNSQHLRDSCKKIQTKIICTSVCTNTYFRRQESCFQKSGWNIFQPG